MKKHKNIGSSLDSFLKGERILDPIELLVEAKFLLRRLSEEFHRGHLSASDVRDTRKKVNSLLKDLSIRIKNKN